MHKGTETAVPQFVSFGFDDNEKSGFTPEKGTEGMKWAVDAFTKRKNPDGSQCACAFYLTTSAITQGESAEAPRYVKKSWKYALDAGCEIGCHSHSHPDGSQFSVEDWVFEMEKCINILTKPYVEGDDGQNSGIGISREDIKSFRAPFLSKNENMFLAVEKMGFLYDCSLEEGFSQEQDGRDFNFPYTFTSGLWELPAYAVVVPPDELCEKYGTRKGLRKKCAGLRDYFYESDGKITGFDYNCLVEFQMTASEFLATLKYTLDLRLDGNRAPFFFGTHAGIYAQNYESEPAVRINESERRKVIEDFLDYAQSKPEVMIVAPIKIIEWMKEANLK